MRGYERELEDNLISVIVTRNDIQVETLRLENRYRINIENKGLSKSYVGLLKYIIGYEDTLELVFVLENQSEKEEFEELVKF